MRVHLTIYIAAMYVLAASTAFGAGFSCSSLFSFEDISKNSFYKQNNLRVRWKYLPKKVGSEGKLANEVFLSRPFKINVNQSSRAIVAQLGGDKPLLYGIKAIDKFEKLLEIEDYSDPKGEESIEPGAQLKRIEGSNRFGTLGSKIYLGLIDKELERVLLYRTSDSQSDKEVYLYVLLIIEPSGWAYEFTVRVRPYG